MPSRTAIRATINRRLKDAQWRDYAMGALKVLEGDPKLFMNMDNGETRAIWFMDVYCQSFRADLIAFEDLIVAAVAWQKILNGKLIYRAIEVRGPPHPDKEDLANKAILLDMIEHYATRGMYGIKAADFWGGTQGADGFIEFDEPLSGHFEAAPSMQILENGRLHRRIRSGQSALISHSKSATACPIKWRHIFHRLAAWHDTRMNRTSSSSWRR